jgi:lipopolysaccharide transport system permease protein
VTGTGTTAEPAVVVIRPSTGWVALNLAELWAYRELLFFLVWRDVKVRYKQTALGAAWAILQPLLSMVVFTIFFGRLAGVGSDGLPYPIFSYVGLLPWTFFSQGVGQASTSIVSTATLVQKVYFPRLIIPLAAIVSGIVDFAVAFVVLLGMMPFYAVRPSWKLVFLPPLLLLAFAATTGIGLLLAALNVRYRDVRYIVPFCIQLWLFATPVIYPMSRVAEKLDALGIPLWVYGLNPMVGVVQGFRWSILGTGTGLESVLVTSIVTSSLLLGAGLVSFRRLERTFADVV